MRVYANNFSIVKKIQNENPFDLNLCRSVERNEKWSINSSRFSNCFCLITSL